MNKLLNTIGVIILIIGFFRDSSSAVITVGL